MSHVITTFSLNVHSPDKVPNRKIMRFRLKILLHIMACSDLTMAFPCLQVSRDQSSGDIRRNSFDTLNLFNVFAIP